MVWANKAALIPILVGIVVFEWVILSFWYSGRLASKEAEIRLQNRQLADYRVTSPAQAKARIEALEQWLRRFEPRQLTDDQQKILRERARVHEHHELTIIFEADSDCATYAAAFEATLREAGWVVYNYQIANPPRRPRSGIAVQVPDLNNIPREAEITTDGVGGCSRRYRANKHEGLSAQVSRTTADHRDNSQLTSRLIRAAPIKQTFAPPDATIPVSHTVWSVH